MDQEIVQQIKDANGAALALVTSLVGDDDLDAMELLLTDPQYGDRATTLAVATIAVSAIKALAHELEVPPLEIVQVAGLSAANYHMMLDEKVEDEEA
jgi:hypothetical protein